MEREHCEKCRNNICQVCWESYNNTNNEFACYPDKNSRNKLTCSKDCRRMMWLAEEIELGIYSSLKEFEESKKGF